MHKLIWHTQHIVPIAVDEVVLWILVKKPLKILPLLLPLLLLDLSFCWPQHPLLVFPSYVLTWACAVIKILLWFRIILVEASNFWIWLKFRARDEFAFDKGFFFLFLWSSIAWLSQVFDGPFFFSLGSQNSNIPEIKLFEETKVKVDLEIFLLIVLAQRTVNLIELLFREF